MKHSYLYFLLSIIAFFSSCMVSAQSLKKLELQVENGFMAKSGNDLSNQLISNSYYNGLTLRLGWQRESPNTYSVIYNHPIYGIGWYASTFHNDYIGYPNALYGFCRTPWYRNNKWTINYELGFGLSYNFEPYDKDINPTNYLIGSYKNAFIHLAATVEYQFASRWSAGAALGFKHFSNGSSQQPNAGINLIPFTLYATWSLNKRQPDFSKREIPAYIKNGHFGVFFCPSSKSFAADEHNYFVATLSFQYLYQVGYKARWGGGIDIFYKGSGPDKVPGDASNFSKSMSYAVFAGYDWVLTERLSLNIAFGLYMKRHYENEETTPYYERVCPRYRISKHFIVGLGIKAHKGGADYLEWTVGYTIFKDKNTY